MPEPSQPALPLAAVGGGGGRGAEERDRAPRPPRVGRRALTETRGPEDCEHAVAGVSPPAALGLDGPAAGGLEASRTSAHASSRLRPTWVESTSRRQTVPLSRDAPLSPHPDRPALRLELFLARMFSPRKSFARGLATHEVRIMRWNISARSSGGFSSRHDAGGGRGGARPLTGRCASGRLTEGPYARHCPPASVSTLVGWPGPVPRARVRLPTVRLCDCRRVLRSAGRVRTADGPTVRRVRLCHWSDWPAVKREVSVPLERGPTRGPCLVVTAASLLPLRSTSRAQPVVPTSVPRPPSSPILAGSDEPDEIGLSSHTTSFWPATSYSPPCVTPLCPICGADGPDGAAPLP